MEKERFLDDIFQDFDSGLISDVDFETLKLIAEDYKKYNISKNGFVSVLKAIDGELGKEAYGTLEEEL